MHSYLNPENWEMFFLFVFDKLKYIPCAPVLEVGMFGLELFHKYVFYVTSNA